MQRMRRRSGRRLLTSETAVTTSVTKRSSRFSPDCNSTVRRPFSYRWSMSRVIVFASKV